MTTWLTRSALHPNRFSMPARNRSGPFPPPPPQLPLHISHGHASRMATIRDDLPPGHHLVTCELLDDTADPGGGKEFRLVAVVHN